jgi:hypothetical protein
MPKRTVRHNPALSTFPELPRLPKGTFARIPALPVWAQPPGERNADIFASDFAGLRAKYPKMTTPEARVFLWLLKHFEDSGGMHNFGYTPSLVPQYRQGGIEVDFLIYETRIAWQVQGEHFHFGDPMVEAQDQVERLVLASAGYTVVDLLESMINQDVDRVCSEAILGFQLYDESLVSAGFTPFVGNAGADRAHTI